MADDAARSRLGRGLASLIGDVGAESQSTDRAPRSQRKVPIEHVRANPRNPRKLFSDAELDELVRLDPRARHHPADRGARRAAPTISRSSPASGAGARRSAPTCTRCRSSCSTSPTAKRSSLRSSRTSSAADLNPLEEATGYQSLANEFNHSQDDIAKIVGKSRSHIANTLRLLKLPERGEGLYQLRQAHRRTCAHAGRPAECRRAGGRRSSIKGLNVRQVEAMARKSGRGQARETKRTGRLGKDADTDGAGKAAVQCARPAGHASITAPTAAACCRCAIARWSSSTTWCGGWKSGPAIEDDRRQLRRAAHPADLKPSHRFISAPSNPSIHPMSAIQFGHWT